MGIADGSGRGRPVESLYQFVREELATSGGSCTRAELRAAIDAHPAARARLDCSRGFAALLSNMKHSGFVSLDGERVRATARRVGRRHR